MTESRVVLIVDDSPEDRWLVRRALSRDRDTAYQIVEADTGAEAMELCQRQRIDCVLLDYLLPDMDGIEFLAELAARPGPGILPVIMITGMGDETVAVRALKAGAQDYLVKGRASDDDVWRTLRGALERAALHEQIERQQRERERLMVDLRQSQAAAEEAVRLRDQFLSVAVHELKTPMTALLGNAQLLSRWLAREEAVSEPTRRIASQLLGQSGRLSRMIAELLDLSKIEQGQFTISMARVDLSGLLRRICADVEPGLARHSLRMIGLDDPYYVEGDELRLSQVFQNLIGNAIKYSPQGGAVTVAATVEGREIHVAVRDEGIGIPAAALPQIFQRFFRAGNAARIAGSGIGLYVVAEIVRRHGGSVRAESVEGAGSCFTVTLPLLER